MKKKKYIKPLFEVEEMNFQSIVALSFGDGNTDTMEGKSTCFDYEEEEDNNE